MMYTQVVNNQKHFSVTVLDQTTKEPLERIHIHPTLINHETNGSLIGYRRYHTHRMAFCNHANNGCLTLWGIAASIIVLIVHARLISPMNFSIFPLGTNTNFRILCVKPFLNFLGTLLVGFLKWTLRSISPTFEVFSHSTNRNFDSEKTTDKIPDGFSRPQGKSKFQLLWCFIANKIFNQRFLLIGQCPLFAKSSSALLESDDARSTLRIQPSGNRGQMQTKNFTDFPVGLVSFIQLLCTFLEKSPSRIIKFSSISFSHEYKINYA